jgi:predicted naringenin-chalcone synthase
MIQPKWDQLSESTQRAVNAPSQSQLQEAYKAGYYRALEERQYPIQNIYEDFGTTGHIRRDGIPDHRIRRLRDAKREWIDATRRIKKAEKVFKNKGPLIATRAARDAARAREISSLRHLKWLKAAKLTGLLTPATLAMIAAELGVAYGPDMSPNEITSGGADRVIGTQ